MLKIIGAVMLISSGAMTGYIASNKLAARVDSIEQCIKFITFIEVEIRYCACLLPQIIGKYKGDSKFCLCIENCFESIGNGEPFPCAWSGSFNKFKSDLCLTDEELKLVSDFGEGLGASDIEGQLKHCRINMDIMENRLSLAIEEKRKKGKLYITMGLCAGLLIAILFI